jgi:hypothetical protein
MDNLQKRARFKAISYAIALALQRCSVTNKKSYGATLECCSYLKPGANGLIGSYCKHRWCIVCNRIRTAALIKAYKPELDDFPDPHFVTLTIPNCSSLHLKSTIKSMYLAIRTINKQFQKSKVGARGIRKLECTYNNETGHFHPHYHIIIDSKFGAMEYVAAWLNQFPESLSFAQDVRPCDSSSYIEIFKYFNKIFKSNYEGQKGLAHPPGALDNIFCCTKGMRIVQPFGLRGAKNEEDVFKELQAQGTGGRWQREEFFYWSAEVADWVLEEDGFVLRGVSGHIQSISDKVLIETIGQQATRLASEW